MKRARCFVSKPGSMVYSCSMLRRKRVATTSNTSETATWPARSVFAKLIRLRLRPTVRVSSFSISETEVPEERKAGTMPKTSPVKMETTKAKPNTLGLILRSARF